MISGPSPNHRLATIVEKNGLNGIIEEKTGNNSTLEPLGRNGTKLDFVKVPSIETNARAAGLGSAHFPATCSNRVHFGPKRN